ncbi:hypothetical protein Tsubulata_025923 [Turnera subulata]|uniref:Protein kinase domain-containing protein n=1 Tax=Turnera subulata TaxID=218843 RepID=A0A9Q0F0J7_9ROSI|nr:hypothetical protein Tsubulata_025923 [Turnera subulata]
MDWTEGVGESSSPPRSFGSFSNYDVRNDVFNRLVESGHQEAVSNPELFREHLGAHFNRLPASYGLDVNMDRVEDVLLHRKLLALAKDPEKRPVYHIRFLENHCTRTDGTDEEFVSVISSTRPACETDEGAVPSHKRIRDCTIDFEPCSKLEDLNLDVRKSSKDLEERYHPENFSKRKESLCVPIHEVIFSTTDKPKLLSQLSALLSDIGLNIREAHVFSTTDGYSLDVFVVDGWPVEDTDDLYKAMEKAIARSEGSWSGSSHSRDRAISALEKSGDWEIDRRLLKIGDQIASGSCGDLYRGVYLGQDVAIKILRTEQLNHTQEEEFAQEVAILSFLEDREWWRLDYDVLSISKIVMYIPLGDFLGVKALSPCTSSVLVIERMGFLVSSSVIRILKSSSIPLFTILCLRTSSLKCVLGGVDRLSLFPPIGAMRCTELIEKPGSGSDSGSNLAFQFCFGSVEVKHRNVVRFIGACTKSPHLCIVTEYMPGGSLYDYLHKNFNVLKLQQLLKFAIDVCKGMEYLHLNNIIHRDLKTANLLMDNDNVVKVADFGVARFQDQGGVMTAETGTYRWMAPEVINHQPYDQKADVFSFAIVLWELVTAKVPYDTMTPLQAALGVRQGLRPELPENAHPKLLDMMQRCWETVPGKRPSFSEIVVELETLLQEVQESTEAVNGN